MKSKLESTLDILEQEVLEELESDQESKHEQLKRYLEHQTTEETKEQYVFLECLTHRLQTVFRINSNGVLGGGYSHFGFLGVKVFGLPPPIGSW